MAISILALSFNLLINDRADDKQLKYGAEFITYLPLMTVDFNHFTQHEMNRNLLLVS